MTLRVLLRRLRGMLTPLAVLSTGAIAIAAANPNGNRIAFEGDRAGNWGLSVMNPDGAGIIDLNAPYGAADVAWSPDGKRVAFYTNYNRAGDSRTWAIAVVAADGSDPTEGEGLAARVVATDVVPDIERGPAWMPDNRRIAYVRDERQAYNPIYMADVDGRTSTLLRTGTKMNHDIACSGSGLIAFRAQVEQWDQVYVAKLKESTP